MTFTSNFQKYEPAIGALLFDLDGTLVDSEGPGLQVLHEQACALGLAWSHAQLVQRCRGVPMAHCVRLIAQHLPAQPAPLDEVAFLRRLREAMAERFRQGLEEMPGASDLLASLTLPFAVATNGPREKAALTLGLTGLARWLEGRVFCAPEVGSYKPEPGLFLHAAQALGCAPQRCAVVEDSVPGMQGGLAAGMRVFSLMPAHELPEGMAEQVVCIGGLAELPRWL